MVEMNKLMLNTIVEKDDRLGWLDGLRGFAILLVMGAHFSIKQKYGVELGISKTGVSFLANILDIGAYGVQLFYMISGFTMCYMWQRYEQKSGFIRNFFIRRFFRLAPLFWLVMIISSIKYDVINETRMFLSFIFMTDFAPFTSYVAGGGTIDLEFTFYLLLPFMVNYMYRVELPILWIAISLVWAYFNKDGALFSKHHFILSQGMFFVIGGYLYHYSKKSAPRILSNAYALPIVLITAIFLLNTINGELKPVFVAGIFFILLLCSCHGTGATIDNRFMRFLGILSFSLYLVHFAVLASLATLIKVYGGYGYGTVGLLILIIPSVLVSIITYMYIEKPGIKLGRRIIKKLENK